MLKLVISDDEGKTTVVPLVRDEITIGRKEGNTIRLTERNVSRRHARLRKQNGAFLLEDLGSYNGIKINGRKMDAHQPVKAGDQIGIGDYLIALQVEGADVPIDVGGASPVAEAQTAMIAAPTDPASPARLVMLSPPAPGAEFALSKPRIRVGRAEDLDICVNHRSISREHVEILQEGDQFRLKDLGSANGVRVNGRDASSVLLNPGDVIELGQVRFRVVGAGETYVFESDRTMQMDAMPPPPAPSRAPIYAAVGIVLIAGIVGVGIAATSGGPSTPQATQLPENTGPVALPTVAVDPTAQVNAFVAACNGALTTDPTTALASANQALALAPGSLEAAACRQQAVSLLGPRQIFEAGKQALAAGNAAEAWTQFSGLPDDSPLRLSPEVAQAADQYAAELIEAGTNASAADPSLCQRNADFIAALPVSPARQAAAARMCRTAPAVAAAVPRTPVDRPERGAPTPPRPASPGRNPPQQAGNPPAAAAPQAPRPNPPPAAPAPAAGGGASRLADARACTISGDHACVIRLLGRASSRSDQELQLLIETYRNQSMWRDACAPINEYLRRFGGSARARNYEQLSVRYCQ